MDGLDHYCGLWKGGYPQGLHSGDGEGILFEVPEDEDYKQLFANSKKGMDLPDNRGNLEKMTGRDSLLSDDAHCLVKMLLSKIHKYSG